MSTSGTLAGLLEARRQQAAALLQAGQAAAAAVHCRTVLADSPADPQALTLLGLAASLTGNPADAVRWLTRAHTIAPHTMAPANGGPLIAALFQWGADLQARGQVPAAIAAYRRLLALAPDHPEARLNLATACRTLGDAAQALDGYRRVLSLQPDAAAAPRLLAEALFAAGDADAAIFWLGRGIALATGQDTTALRERLSVVRRYALFHQQTADVLALAEPPVTAPETVRAIAFRLMQISTVFSHRVEEHGATPSGISVHDADYHHASLTQLVRLLPADGAGGWTVNDIGCGYGAFFDHIAGRLHPHGVRYFGYDISPAMVVRARARIDDPRAVFTVSSMPLWPADYSIAAGIFNLNLDHEPAEWQAYFRAQLRMMARMSRVAFAVNALRPSFSDLFRLDAGPVVDFVRAHISDRVTILDGYSDIEWTLWVEGPFKS